MVVNGYFEEVLKRKTVTDFFSWFEAVILGLKPPGSENNYSPQSDTEVKKAWIHTSPPPYFLMPCIEVSLLLPCQITILNSDTSWDTDGNVQL